MLTVVRRDRRHTRARRVRTRRGDGDHRSWNGIILQATHRPVAQQNRHVPEGVYSSWWANGSPAHMYGLRATVWITEVNGHPVPDLDTFVDLWLGATGGTGTRATRHGANDLGADVVATAPGGAARRRTATLTAFWRSSSANRATTRTSASRRST